MSRLSQAFAFFNLPPEKLTADWASCHMNDFTINDKMKELRRLHRKVQKQEAKNNKLFEVNTQEQAINNEEADLNLVLEGKMTKEEYRNKWIN